MANTAQFYIDGRWVDPVVAKTIEVIDPATEQPFARLAMGSAADVDKAVAAAKRAFPSFSLTTREQRLSWLRALLEAYNARYEDIAKAVSQEMGAPVLLQRRPGLVRAGPPGVGDQGTGGLCVLRRPREHPHCQGAHRGCRADHTMELAVESDRHQGSPGAGRRLHHGAQTQ